MPNRVDEGFEKASFNERVSEWASFYDEVEPRTLAAKNLISRQRLALEMVDTAVPPKSRILDAGCGTGEMVGQLIERGHEVWGIDIAEPMVRHTHQHFGQARFQVASVESIPFRDNTFDAVICLGVLEYLDADEKVLHEMWRVLKPGGRAIIATPSAIWPMSYVDRAFYHSANGLRPIYYFFKYGLLGRQPPEPNHCRGFIHRRFYPGRWQRLLMSVNLPLEKTVCHGWGWYGSWHLGFLMQHLSRKAGSLRHALERALGTKFVSHAVEALSRNRLLNWLLAEQIVRVRAVKSLLVLFFSVGSA